MSLQNALLGILTYSPMTGYQLGKVFDQSINYSWTASLSQIYRELGTLEKKEYVTSSIEAQEDKPDKKIYAITEAGQSAFETWLLDFPESFASPKRDAFMLRIFFGSKVGNEELIRQFKRFIKERSDFNQMMLNAKPRMAEMNQLSLQNGALQLQMKGDQYYWRFIMKRALMSNQALIDWAKECVEELEDEIRKETNNE